MSVHTHLGTKYDRNPSPVIINQSVAYQSKDQNPAIQSEKLPWARNLAKCGWRTRDG